MNKQVVVSMVLFFAVIATALLLVYCKHLNRQYFAKLDQAQKQRDQLQVEWSQLLLEQSTLTAHGRIERIAKESLNMTIPTAKEVVHIR